MTVHVVQPDDTLWKISRLYDVSIETIMDVNGLQSSLLLPGIALYIPGTSLTMRYYQIEPGDSLSALAEQFNTNVKTIIAANRGLNSTNLIVGQKIMIPSENKLAIRTLGFTVPYSIPDTISELTKIARHLTYIAVASYSFTEEGLAYVVLPDAPIVEKSNQLHVVPLLMIRNILADGEFSPELVGRVLESATLRKRLVQSIVDFVSEKDYGGVSIDFEFIPPPRRIDFITFLQEIKEELREKTLHVNVHAKTSDVPDNPIIGAYDYEAIGKVADFVALMTMDYGYPGGPPNPVAPLWWMDEVIRYSLRLIAPNKLQTAFPLYGYDWIVPSHDSSGLSNLQAQNQAIDRKVAVDFDLIDFAPHYMYSENENAHHVWFEDIRSYIGKYQLLDVYELSGTTFWQIGLAFPQNWAYINDHIHVIR